MLLRLGGSKKVMAKTSILKSNFVFGGAQIVQMLTIVLRAKLIAVMLGSAGMGLNAIFQSVLHIVNNVCACGIMQSSVREIAQVSAEQNEEKLNFKIQVFRLLLGLSALLGLLVCCLGAWPLSSVSFGNASYVFSFVVLGVGTMFFTLMQGELSILQGTRQVKSLAIASIVGSVTSLIVCIPCYYFLQQAGVAWAIAIANFAYWLIYLYFTRQLSTKKVHLSLRKALHEGKPMITLGFVLMLGSFLVTLFTYLTNVSIRLLGTIEDVGLYQGAAAIATQSILVVTSVLAADFFPRLSAVANDCREQNKLVNEQLVLVVLAVASIACIVICFAPIIIRLLLSADFLVVAPMLKLMATALLFRGVWIVMSYVILSQGDRRSYFIYDGLIGNGLNFVIGIAAYYGYGLTGIGVANVLTSLLVAGILFIVVYKKYHARLTSISKRTLVVASLLMAICYTLSVCCGYWSAIGVLVTLCWCLVKLEKQYGLLTSVQRRFCHKS